MNDQKKLRIVVGADDAGVQYKDILKADLEGDGRLVEVIDVGVSADENTAYPYCRSGAPKGPSPLPSRSQPSGAGAAGARRCATCGEMGGARGPNPRRPASQNTATGIAQTAT